MEAPKGSLMVVVGYSWLRAVQQDGKHNGSPDTDPSAPAVPYPASTEPAETAASPGHHHVNLPADPDI